MPYPSSVGECLPESEGTTVVTLPVTTVERFAYFLLPTRDEIARRERGYQKMFTMREHLNRCPRLSGACVEDWEATSDHPRWSVCCLRDCYHLAGL